MSNLDEFGYLAQKVEQAPFVGTPFTHLYLENFLSEEHFNSLVRHRQFNIEPPRTTEDLIKVLLERGWEIQLFPGCTTSIRQYLKCFYKNSWPVDKKRLEGFGMAFRLKRYDDDFAVRLVDYLNGQHFKSALERKFKINRPNRIKTAIQKYLSGYEICPHPDIRAKCLTYLVNINTDQRCEDLSIHTQLLEFIDQKRFIYEFWKFNDKSDTDWVPWGWCKTKFEARKNNSLIMFAPSWNTLHAVKLRYDHLLFQRTQIYGNLWYTDAPLLDKVSYEKFDIKPKAIKAYAQRMSVIMRGGFQYLLKYAKL